MSSVDQCSGQYVIDSTQSSFPSQCKKNLFDPNFNHFSKGKEVEAQKSFLLIFKCKFLMESAHLPMMKVYFYYGKLLFLLDKNNSQGSRMALLFGRFSDCIIIHTLEEQAIMLNIMTL